MAGPPHTPGATGSPGSVELTIAWLGHATVDVRLDADGSTDRFVTDPVLRDRSGHLRRHRGTGALDDVEGVSAVLLSHLHHDHLDLPSLRRLPAGLPCIVPTGAAHLLRNTTLDVLEVAVGDDVRIGDTVVTAVPAKHHSGRFASRRRAEAVGYVMRRDDRTVYFPGDTDLHPAMGDLPRPDVALLPIWGWGRTIGTGHLDPARAATAAAVLDARAVLPIHWGTFAPVSVRRGAPRWFDQPAERLADEMAETSPGTALTLVRPGPDRHVF